MNSYKLYAVNYADPAYEFRRKVNTDSLKKFGKVDEVFEYGSAGVKWIHLYEKEYQNRRLDSRMA